MSVVVYKVVHYLGIFLLVATLAAAMGRRTRAEGDDPWRKRFAALHGTALFLVLLGGFGMLARLGYGFPGWIWAKLVLWVLLAGMLTVARKSATWAGRLLWVVPLLATLAGWLAFAKPF